MRKILIIDDDQDIGFILDMVLGVDYHTRIITDASNIITVYADFMPDLIIIDNFIGRSKAADVMNELKQTNPDCVTPYILFSAASDIEQIAKDIHASGYLPKPFSLSALRFVVEAMLQVEAAGR